MQTKYGFNMPQKMREDFGYAVKSVSDHLHKELSHEEIRDIFLSQYVNIEHPISYGKYPHHADQSADKARSSRAAVFPHATSYPWQ